MLILVQRLSVDRAPVLVALALIELGMKYEDAVELIRELVLLFFSLSSKPMCDLLYSQD